MVTALNKAKEFNPTDSFHGLFLSIIYLGSIALYYLDTSGFLKYFQYLLPIIGLLVSIDKLYKVWYNSAEIGKLCNILLLISFINLLVVLTRGDIYLKFFQEFFLFVGALIFAITVIGNYAYFLPKLLPASLYILILIFLIDKGPELIAVLQDPNMLLMGFVSSNVSTESSLAFYFAILSFYFLVEKDKSKAFIAIIFMILCFKRIACIGFLASIIVYYSSNVLKIKYNRKIYATILSSINFIYLWNLILLINGSFDEFISNTFGVSSNFLFMGRIDLYKNIFDKLGYVDILGMGIGRVSDLLNNYDESGIGEGILTNLHSDILKYYLEFGILSFIVFIYNFFLYLSKNLTTFCLCVMLNIIFLTDNVSIYFGFMVLFFLVNFKLSCTSKIGENRSKFINTINNKYRTQTGQLTVINRL